MLPVAYRSERAYIMSCSTKAEKVAAIDNIIEALLGQVLTLAQQDKPVLEYKINSGQTIIQTSYDRDTTKIMNTVDALRKLRNIYINNGERAMRMVDIKNVIGRRRC